MAYEVLARKWRPRNFSQLVGQEHVQRALINALDQDRVHHAFLFTGTRGVGKTTIARILSKSLNCLEGVSSQPCGECAACTAIDAGRYVDLLEIDAASRTGVDDIRELLDNVQYAPTQGRYKVYLIDEVHMLSNSAFNALLKTLEEPPPHVKFLLATTDPQKLPITILSRCIQFNLKRLTEDLIRNHLTYVLEQEEVAAEAGGVQLIAHGADGSMRDALSLLDQAIAYGAGQVTEAEVQAMLGTVSREHIQSLVEGLIALDSAALLAVAVKVAQQSVDFGNVLESLATALQRIAVVQQVPALADQFDYAAWAGYAEQLSPADVQLYYQIALTSRRDLSLAPDLRVGFEMALLRMVAFSQEAPAPGKSPAKRATQSSASADSVAVLRSDAQDTARDTAQAVPATTPVAHSVEPSESKPTASPAAANTEKEAVKEPAKHANAPAGMSSDMPPEMPPEMEAHFAMQDSAEPPPWSTEEQPTAASKVAPAEPRASTESSAAVVANVEPNVEPSPRPSAEPSVRLNAELSAEPTAEPKAELGAEPSTELSTRPEETSPPDATKSNKTAIPLNQDVDWSQLVGEINVRGMVKQLAMNCALKLIDDAGWVLQVSADAKHMNNDSLQTRLQDAISDYFGQPVRLTFEMGTGVADTPAQRHKQAVLERQQRAEESIARDPNIQALQTRFNATIVQGSVKPLEQEGS